MQVKVLQNALLEHSAIHSTIIKLSFVFKTFVLSFFEWPLKTGFTVNVFTFHFRRLFSWYFSVLNMWYDCGPLDVEVNI